jgi:O-antigen/teichoic acid export membrane protein
MHLVVRCLRLVIVGTIPLATMLTIFAGDIIGSIFGPQFLAATIALQVLAWTLPLRGVQWLLGSQLAAMDKQSALARARTASLCAFLTLTPLLILGVGFVGAAWAVLICDGLQLGLYWRLLKSADSAPALSERLLAPVLAAMATLGASTMLLHLSLPLRVLGVCLVMGISLWVTGAIRRQDLVFLRKLVKSGERALDRPRS